MIGLGRSTAIKTLAPLLTLIVLSGLAFTVASAFAETPGTGWMAYSQAFPTNLPPGGSGALQVDIINTGATPSAGAITVTDTLPAGLTATKAGGMLHAGTRILSTKEEAEYPYTFVYPAGPRWVCTGNGTGEDDVEHATVITCTSNPASLPSLPLPERFKTFPPGDERIGIAVAVEGGAPERKPAPSSCVAGSPQPAYCNRVTIAGGGASAAASAGASDPVTVSSSAPGFGFPGWDVSLVNRAGATDTQAGSHPYAVTVVNGFDELATGKFPDGEARDLEAVQPPGFFGDPGAVPRCTLTQLDAQQCPAQSQIGIDTVGKREGEGAGMSGFVGPFAVYSIVPPPGVPDEFAFTVAGINVFFDAGVRSGHGYGIVEHIDNIPQVRVDLNILKLWGVPAEASHDAERCEAPESTHIAVCGLSSGIIPKPFLTLPTSCEGPQPFALRGLSTWTNEHAPAEASVLTHDSNGAQAGFTGCEKLSILPSLSAVPDTAFADTPAGLTAEVEVPQETLELPDGLVAATLKNTSVTLPAGIVVNPGQAAGLQACGEAEANVHGEGPQSCPAASKVGTVEIKTPLLEEQLEPELEGNVYVLQSNPPELKLLVAASADGIYLKLPGTVQLNEATGQLTTTFEETPELPFTDFKLSFSGGAQAALATPTQCGAYTTSSDFTAWTSPFTAEILGSSSFPISSGPGGGACPSGALPFSPSLIAGATNPKGGGFTNFSLLLQRGDGQQRIDGLQFKAPAGLTGELSNVPLCTNAQAESNTCPEASKIGHTVVESGPGPYPLVVPEPGQEPAPIYLTESYNGHSGCTVTEAGCAPFGLSIVVPLHVGPFTLPTQRVRAKIEVDPTTAALTVTTNPLPQVVAGVPTDLREIDAVIERPEFMINPTHCAPASFSGTAYGTPPPGAGGANASAAISTSFDVVGCKELAFAPKLTVSTQGKTSKARGASLTATVTYPQAAPGTYANVGLAKVELPKQLPSRLTTLQKACTAKAFEANPASCPSESFIGHAVVHTPLLPVPLEGPAIFVSHGGEAFPSVEVVLQGDNVKVILVGTTFISKAGITSTTFKTVPDAPFSSFELTLPEGPYSALAANGNLCAQKLVMPNEFIGQNGAPLHGSTDIAVEGCSTSLAISSHSIKRKTLTLSVYVPAAGKVKVTGKGLSSKTKTVGGRETLTFELTQKKGGKLSTKIEASFTPSKGRRQSKAVKVRFAR
jgi:uncharacterized repeat protein (TIGR01451 family)